MISDACWVIFCSTALPCAETAWVWCRRLLENISQLHFLIPNFYISDFRMVQPSASPWLWLWRLFTGSPQWTSQWKHLLSQNEERMKCLHFPLNVWQTHWKRKTWMIAVVKVGAVEASLFWQKRPLIAEALFTASLNNGRYEPKYDDCLSPILKTNAWVLFKMHLNNLNRKKNSMCCEQSYFLNEWRVNLRCVSIFLH